MKMILEKEEWKNIDQGISNALYAFQELQNDYDSSYKTDIDDIYEWLTKQNLSLVAGNLKEIFKAINKIKANFE